MDDLAVQRNKYEQRVRADQVTVPAAEAQGLILAGYAVLVGGEGD